MSILVTQEGKIVANEQHINQWLFPAVVGKFHLSDKVDFFMAHEMNTDNVDRLFKFIPSQLDLFATVDKKLIPTRASIFNS